MEANVHAVISTIRDRTYVHLGFLGEYTPSGLTHFKARMIYPGIYTFNPGEDWKHAKTGARMVQPSNQVLRVSLEREIMAEILEASDNPQIQQRDVKELKEEAGIAVNSPVILAYEREIRLAREKNRNRVYVRAGFLGEKLDVHAQAKVDEKRRVIQVMQNPSTFRVPEKAYFILPLPSIEDIIRASLS